MLGVFDSGFGGLTVLRAIHQRLPDVSTIYLGDNARAPYGNRTHEEIFTFTLEGVRELLAPGCPLVVLACNTASAQALRQIQQTVLPVEFPDRRVLGVIRPTAEEIVSRTKSGHIGVMATPATVRSGAYLREITDAAEFSPPLQGGGRRGSTVVTQIACPGIVELIEAGHEHAPETDELVGQCVHDLLRHDPLIDAVLLGCTHYPLVMNLFRRHLPPHVAIVTQGPIVADKLADYLNRHPDLATRLGKTGNHQYLTTKQDETISPRASRFYGTKVIFTQVRLNETHSQQVHLSRTCEISELG
jgi:glutamate racemase